MSASMWIRAADGFVDNSDATSPSKIAQGLQSRDVALLELIEYIGNYLTSEDPFVRGKVVRLLSEVLHQLPTDFLAQTEVHLLVTYFCERLKDHHSVQPPTLHGLLALSSSTHLADESSKTICGAIFQDVQNQTLAQADRGVVYTIFSILLDNKLKVLQEMGNDFVYGFIQAMDTEKDPRNLLTAFYCARKIILNISLGVFVEEMFEVTSCYFPIDFTPPANDPHSITRDDLILGLRGCLSASEKFGPFCLPLLLEKLTSDVQSAKLDSFLTLAACCEVYGSECLREYQGSLFRCIKQEIYASGSPTLEEAGLNALTAMSNTMSPKMGVSTEESDVDDFLKEVLQDCRRHLKDEDLQLFVPTCRLLQAICMGSDHAASKVLSELFPLLIDVYNKQLVTTQRKKVLECLLMFIPCLRKFKMGKAHKVIRQHKGSVFSTLLLATSDKDPTIQCTAVSGIGDVLSVTELLNSEERINVAGLLVDKTFSSFDTEVRNACVQSIKVLAEVDVPTTQSVILPSLISKLNTDSMDVDGSVSTQQHVFTLLAAISVTDQILTTVVKELVTCFSNLAEGASDHSKVEKTHGIATCLVTIATCCVSRKMSMELYFYNTLLQISKLFVLSSLNTRDNDSNLYDTAIVQSVSKLMRIVATHLDNKSLSDMCLQLTKVFLFEDIRDIAKDTPSELFCPFNSSSPWQQTQLVSVVMPVICSCPEQVGVPQVDKYIEKLTELSVYSQHQHTRIAATKYLAHLINTHKTDDYLTEYLTTRQKQSIDDMNSSNRHLVLQQWLWLTKALVMRGHSLSNNFLKKVIELLADTELGEQAASGFEIILSDQDEVLNKAMHANIRMMYKQRLFIENSAALVHGFEQATQECKKNYLLSLSHMLKHLPKQVLLRELPPMFPMLIQSLMSDDVSLQMSTVLALTDLISDAPELVASHIDSVIQQLLKFCNYQPLMKVRINALKCLQKLVILPEPVVLPHRKRIIYALEPILDDKKRLVRKDAVEARNNWFLLGEPGR